MSWNATVYYIGVMKWNIKASVQDLGVTPAIRWSEKRLMMSTYMTFEGSLALRCKQMAMLVEHYFETNFSNIDQWCLSSMGRASKLIIAATLCPQSTWTEDRFKCLPPQQEAKFQETQRNRDVRCHRAHIFWHGQVLFHHLCLGKSRCISTLSC